MFDLLVRGGQVLDGSGAPSFPADVAVRDGLIVGVGSLPHSEAHVVLDAGDLVVAPGFVDMHSHSDLGLLVDPYAQPKLRQGVTTEVVGQCGLGPAPASPERAGRWSQYLAGILGEAGTTWPWRSFGDYLYSLGRRQPAVNVGGLVTHGAVRCEAMGLEDRPPTGAELDRMKRLVDESLAAGAFGMSTGLVYAPCAFADRIELVELYRVVGRRGSFMAIHLRSQAWGLVESVEEAVDIAQAAEVALHVSHLCAMGRPNWHKVQAVLSLIDDARARGHDVTFDQHPYSAGSTFLSQVLPLWTMEGGAEAMVSRLQDGSIRGRIAQEIAAGGGDPASGWENYAGMAGWDNILITAVGSASNRLAIGRTVAQLAETKGREPVDVACDLLVEERGAVTMVMLGLYEEEGIATIMRHPAHTVGSDAMVTPGQPHPRLYGTFPRVLGRYVRERGVVSLARAVHDMTGAAARRLGLSDRGRVKVGQRADLVIFDPGRVSDTATYERPEQYPEGIRYVIVNGSVALREGNLCSERAGEVLRA